MVGSRDATSAGAVLIADSQERWHAAVQKREKARNSRTQGSSRTVLPVELAKAVAKVGRAAGGVSRYRLEARKEDTPVLRVQERA
ncbi:hypothetical protein FGB62_24g020 [Gracilaria domingensis]|nr:hypothetical protein FGB62_24g020 [Gracilaria domingensis]